jgi:hypothetical protein
LGLSYWRSGFTVKHFNMNLNLELKKKKWGEVKWQQWAMPMSPDGKSTRNSS